MEVVGKSMKRVDAFGKVTGEAKYTNDLCPKDALIAHRARRPFNHREWRGTFHRYIGSREGARCREDCHLL